MSIKYVNKHVIVLENNYFRSQLCENCRCTSITLTLTSNNACRIHTPSSGFYEIHTFGQKEGSTKTVLDLEFARQVVIINLYLRHL